MSKLDDVINDLTDEVVGGAKAVADAAETFANRAVAELGDEVRGAVIGKLATKGPAGLAAATAVSIAWSNEHPDECKAYAEKMSAIAERGALIAGTLEARHARYAKEEHDREERLKTLERDVGILLAAHAQRRR